MLHIHKNQIITKIVYNQQILIRPNAFTDINEYIQWAIEPPLTPSSKIYQEEYFHLVGPFNFESIYQQNQTQKVHIHQWRSLQNQCRNLGILPPTFCSNYNSKPQSSNKSKIVSKIGKENLKKDNVSTTQQKSNMSRIQYI